MPSLALLHAPLSQGILKDAGTSTAVVQSKSLTEPFNPTLYTLMLFF